MTSFARIQLRLLRVGLLSLTVVALMRFAVSFGATEPQAFILGVIPVMTLALTERLWRKNLSKGSAAAISGFIGPAALFALNDVYPSAFTELLRWPAGLGLLLGFFHLFWSVFMRPAQTASEQAD